MELKSADISEDASNSEVKEEALTCVKQELNEYGPVNLQPENNSVVTASTKREQPDDMNPVKQETGRSSRQDQEDGGSHRSEGICTF
jgi:hypothetical protein